MRGGRDTVGGRGVQATGSYSFLIRVVVTQVSTLNNLTISRFVHIDVHMLDLFFFQYKYLNVPVFQQRIQRITSKSGGFYGKSNKTGICVVRHQSVSLGQTHAVALTFIFLMEFFCKHSAMALTQDHWYTHQARCSGYLKLPAAMRHPQRCEAQTASAVFCQQ